MSLEEVHCVDGII